MMKKWAIIVVVMGMLIGLFGCGKNTSTPEQIAERYLERKYEKTFIVSKLTKKDAGSFQTPEYSGFAYEEGNPELQFKVWVSDDKKHVYDAYYSAQLLPAINSWLQERAEEQWDSVRVAAIPDVLRYHADADYAPDDFMDFLSEESVVFQIYLILPEEELTMETYRGFDEAIKKYFRGYNKLLFVSENQMETTLEDVIRSSDHEVSIMIGSSESVIADKLKDMRG